MDSLSVTDVHSCSSVSFRLLADSSDKETRGNIEIIDFFLSQNSSVTKEILE